MNKGAKGGSVEDVRPRTTSLTTPCDSIKGAEPTGNRVTSTITELIKLTNDAMDKIPDEVIVPSMFKFKDRVIKKSFSQILIDIMIVAIMLSQTTTTINANPINVPVVDLSRRIR